MEATVEHEAACVRTMNSRRWVTPDENKAKSGCKASGCGGLLGGWGHSSSLHVVILCLDRGMRGSLYLTLLNTQHKSGSDSGAKCACVHGDAKIMAENL